MTAGRHQWSVRESGKGQHTCEVVDVLIDRRPSLVIPGISLSPVTNLQFSRIDSPEFLACLPSCNTVFCLCQFDTQILAFPNRNQAFPLSQRLLDYLSSEYTSKIIILRKSVDVEVPLKFIGFQGQAEWSSSDDTADAKMLVVS